MKVYSIGRESGCDIVINDSSDVISRRHAILNVMPSGKMTIVDQSHNGTYVNGIRISPNVPVPVTRKDNVSLAHVARLDWNLIPKPASIWRYLIIAAIAIAAVVGGVILYNSLTDKSTGEADPVQGEKSQPAKVDSCQVCKKPVVDCEYKGKHPTAADTCATCLKPISECQYKGKHPAPAKPQKPKGKESTKTKETKPAKAQETKKEQPKTSRGLR